MVHVFHPHTQEAAAFIFRTVASVLTQNSILSHSLSPHVQSFSFIIFPPSLTHDVVAEHLPAISPEGNVSVLQNIPVVASQSLAPHVHMLTPVFTAEPSLITHGELVAQRLIEE